MGFICENAISADMGALDDLEGLIREKWNPRQIKEITTHLRSRFEEGLMVVLDGDNLAKLNGEYPLLGHTPHQRALFFLGYTTNIYVKEVRGGTIVSYLKGSNKQSRDDLIILNDEAREMYEKLKAEGYYEKPIDENSGMEYMDGWDTQKLESQKSD